MPIEVKATNKTQSFTKWQKIFTPQIIVATVLCVFCAIMAIVCLLNPGTKETSITSPVENMDIIGVITPKDKVVQTFVSDGNYSSFGLYYANYVNYIQGGELLIDVEGSNGESSKFTYDIGGIIDNTIMYVDYPLKENVAYTITIQLSDDAEGITFFSTASTENYEAKLTINKNPRKDTIIMAFATEVEDSFTAWYYVMAIVIILCYIVLKIDRGAYV